MIQHNFYVPQLAFSLFCRIFQKEFSVNFHPNHAHEDTMRDPKKRLQFKFE